MPSFRRRSKVQPLSSENATSTNTSTSTATPPTQRAVQPRTRLKRLRRQTPVKYPGQVHDGGHGRTGAEDGGNDKAAKAHSPANPTQQQQQQQQQQEFATAASDTDPSPVPSKQRNGDTAAPTAPSPTAVIAWRSAQQHEKEPQRADTRSSTSSSASSHRQPQVGDRQDVLAPQHNTGPALPTHPPSNLFVTKVSVAESSPPSQRLQLDVKAATDTMGTMTSIGSTSFTSVSGAHRIAEVTPGGPLRVRSFGEHGSSSRNSSSGHGSDSHSSSSHNTSRRASIESDNSIGEFPASDASSSRTSGGPSAAANSQAHTATTAFAAGPLHTNSSRDANDGCTSNNERTRAFEQQVPEQGGDARRDDVAAAAADNADDDNDDGDDGDDEGNGGADSAARGSPCFVAALAAFAPKEAEALLQQRAHQASTHGEQGADGVGSGHAAAPGTPLSQRRMLARGTRLPSHRTGRSLSMSVNHGASARQQEGGDTQPRRPSTAATAAATAATAAASADGRAHLLNVFSDSFEQSVLQRYQQLRSSISRRGSDGDGGLDSDSPTISSRLSTSLRRLSNKFRSRRASTASLPSDSDSSATPAATATAVRHAMQAGRIPEEGHAADRGEEVLSASTPSGVGSTGAVDVPPPASQRACDSAEASVQRPSSRSSAGSEASRGGTSTFPPQLQDEVQHQKPQVHEPVDAAPTGSKAAADHVSPPPVGGKRTPSRVASLKRLPVHKNLLHRGDAPVHVALACCFIDDAMHGRLANGKNRLYFESIATQRVFLFHTSLVSRGIHLSCCFSPLFFSLPCVRGCVCVCS